MAQSQSVSPALIERSTVGLSYRGSYFTLATLLRERQIKTVEVHW